MGGSGGITRHGAANEPAADGGREDGGRRMWRKRRGNNCFNDDKAARTGAASPPPPPTHLPPPPRPLSPFSVGPSIHSFSAAAFEKSDGRENIEAERSSDAQNIPSFIDLPL